MNWGVCVWVRRCVRNSRTIWASVSQQTVQAMGGTERQNPSTIIGTAPPLGEFQRAAPGELVMRRAAASIHDPESVQGHDGVRTDITNVNRVINAVAMRMVLGFREIGNLFILPFINEYPGHVCKDVEPTAAGSQDARMLGDADEEESDPRNDGALSAAATPGAQPATAAALISTQPDASSMEAAPGTQPDASHSVRLPPLPPSRALSLYALAEATHTPVLPTLSAHYWLAAICLMRIGRMGFLVR